MLWHLCVLAWTPPPPPTHTDCANCFWGWNSSLHLPFLSLCLEGIIFIQRRIMKKSVKFCHSKIFNEFGWRVFVSLDIPLSYPARDPIFFCLEEVQTWLWLAYRTNQLVSHSPQLSRTWSLDQDFLWLTTGSCSKWIRWVWFPDKTLQRTHAWLVEDPQFVSRSTGLHFVMKVSVSVSERVGHGFCDSSFSLLKC